MSTALRLGLMLVRPILRPLPPGPWPAVQALRERVAAGFVLHGSRRGDIEVIQAAPQMTAFGQRVTGVFGSKDPVWPMFYALVDRDVAGALRTLCSPGRGGTRYGFSTEHDPRLDSGWVYVLPGDGFDQVPGTCEWVCTDRAGIRPLERIAVRPEDFPFVTCVGRHQRAEGIAQTWWRQRPRKSGSAR